jgi:putative ABC transport system substrate-binding protein
VNVKVILPLLLERSWEQNLVLFSSKPAHAKRGALFSMFPNHLELGKQLAVMIE